MTEDTQTVDRMAAARAAKVAKKAAKDAELAETIIETPEVLEVVAETIQGDTGDERLAKLEGMVADLVGAVETLATRPQIMARTVAPDKRLSDMALRDGESAQWRKVKDLKNPRAQDSGFQPDDIVSVTGDRAGAFVDALGVVMSYMYTKRIRPPATVGLRKYKVHFEGLGTDGFTEDELVMVQAA